MSVHHFYDVGPATVQPYQESHALQFPAATSDVLLFFPTLTDVAAWLQDALDRVQVAKAEHASTQPEDDAADFVAVPL